MKKSFLITVLVLMMAGWSYGVNDTVSVSIQDNTGSLLPGLNVFVTNTSNPALNPIKCVYLNNRYTAVVRDQQIGDIITIVPIDTTKYTFVPKMYSTTFKAGSNYVGFFRATIIITGVIKNQESETTFKVNNAYNKINYTLISFAPVNIEYYNLQGKLINKFTQVQAKGSYCISLPIADYPKGTYIQMFKAGSFIKKDKITLY